MICIIELQLGNKKSWFTVLFNNLQSPISNVAKRYVCLTSLRNFYARVKCMDWNETAWESALQLTSFVIAHELLFLS